MPTLASGRGPLGGHLLHIVPLALPVVGAAWILLPDVVRRTWRRARTPRAPGLPRSSAAVRLTAAASTVAAGVHLAVMPAHFRESALYGAFFLGAAIAQLGFAAWLVVRPSRPLLRLGMAGNAGIVALWLLTRTVGVPLGPGRGHTETVGTLDLVATTSEAVLVAAALIAARAPRPAARRSPVDQGEPLAVPRPRPAHLLDRQEESLIDSRG